MGDSITQGVTNLGGSASDVLSDNGRGYGQVLDSLIDMATGESALYYQSGIAGLRSYDYTLTGTINDGTFTYTNSILPTFITNARSSLGETPDITLVLLGTNDAVSGVSTEDYETYMRDVVSLLLATGTTPVLVHVPPIYNSSSVEIYSDYTGGYVSSLDTIANDTGAINGPDIYNVMKDYVTSFGGYRSLYFDTGIHPNDLGFSVMAQEAINTLMLTGGNTTATANLSYLTETGLTPNTQYQRVMYAMNSAGNGVGATSSAIYTLANVPASVSASQSGSTIVVTWDDNDNPAGTEYYVSDSTDGTNSGWITTTTHTFSSPSVSGSHTITVKSRNGDSAETAGVSTTVTYTPASSGGGGSSSSSSSTGSVTLFVPFNPGATVGSQTNTNTQNTITPTQPVKPNEPIVLSIPSSIVEPYSTSADVRTLQTLLAADPSIYPQGLITGYYGELTIKAVRTFQIRYGVISGGTLADGFGRVGPKTLAKIKEVYGSNQTTPINNTTPTNETPQPIQTAQTLTGPFVLGGTSEQNKVLQKYLAKDPIFYPEGIISGYYGPLTQKAVGRFQEQYGIAKPGDEFYGYAGPNTRAKLIEVLGK